MGNDTVNFSKKILMIKLKKKFTYQKFFLPARLSKLGHDLPQGYVLQKCFLPARLSKLGRDLLQGYVLQKCFLLARLSKLGRDLPQGYILQQCFLPARLSKLGRDLPQGYVLIELQHVDDNRFEPENKKAYINQNVQVQDLPKPIGVPNVKSSVTRPILMLK